MAPGLALLGAVLGAQLWAPAAAQTGMFADAAAPLGEVVSGLVVIDPERLFDESAYGRRVLAEIQRRSAELAAENREIEAALRAEEQTLAERRPQMQMAAFRELARAFDTKVRGLRQEQDAKVRAVTRLRDDAQQRFFGEIGDILLQLAQDRGAAVILDQRSVFLATAEIDVTDAAIALVDARLGSGDGNEAPAAPGPAAGDPPGASPDTPPDAAPAD